MIARAATCLLVLLFAGVGGCIAPGGVGGAINKAELRRAALACLQSGVSYRANPVVRIAAVEALVGVDSKQAKAWIRSALNDEHPAVRFAACLAVGTQRDTVAELSVRKLSLDADPNVRVGALFALHRLGETNGTGKLTSLLLDHADPSVRRNAALILGMCEQTSAIKPLARAMKDSDEGVRRHALEAMVRLGNREARQELIFMCNAGVGADETFAVNALAEVRSPLLGDTFRYKLKSGKHWETRLAAARALALLSNYDGFDETMRALKTKQFKSRDRNDPPQQKTLRIRQMATAALGVMGKEEALPTLARIMTNEADPRLQVSAAQAILKILRAHQDLFLWGDRAGANRSGG